MHLKLLFLVILAFSFLSAEESSQKISEHVIVLPAGMVHNGDYFAAGDSIEISGTVNGDVYVLGEQIIVDGVVNGDVLACGGSIDISGNVLRNCRLLGGQVLLSGIIGNNVTVIAASVQALPFSRIGEGIVSIAGNMDLVLVGTNATLIASNLRVSSDIKNDLHANVGHMRLTSKAQVGGNIDYRSSVQAWIEPGAVIRGSITHHPSFVHELVKGTWIHSLLIGSKLIGTLMNFLYTFAIGVILLKLFPKNLEAALQVLRTQPLKSILYGILLLVLLPLAALILLMTILGAPFALTLIALNIIGFYTAKIYSIFWGANWLFGKMGMKNKRYITLLCGLILYFLIVAIPIFGTIIAVAAMLFGVGAGVLSQGKRGIFNVQSND